MSLTATPSTSQERVLLAWSAPGGTYDSVRVSMKPTADTIWVQVYNGPNVATRYVYPIPGISYDFKLETVTAGVASLSATLSGVTLDWYSDEWGVLLVDTTTGIMIPLGFFASFQSMKQTRKSKVQSVVMMGAIFPKDWKSRAKYQVFPSFATSVPANWICSDGTITDNRTAVIKPLWAVSPPAMSLLLMRDRQDDIYTFVTIVPDPDIAPFEGGGWDVNLVLEERRPPTGGFSTAT